MIDARTDRVNLSKKIQCGTIFQTIESSNQRSFLNFRGAALVLLLLSGSSYAQNATPNQKMQKEISMAQLATGRPGVAPQQASAAIRPFHVNIPEEQLVDLRRRVAAAKWPDKET